MAGHLQPNNARYIAQLEATVKTLTDEVRHLKARAMERGRKTNMKDMQTTYEWTEKDYLLSIKVMTFCNEFLFPRHKFIADESWLVYSEEKSFCQYVMEQMQIAGENCSASEWDRVISKSIVKKYTDMRCNLNMAVKDAYIGEQ